jgi:hypothetical protein
LVSYQKYPTRRAITNGRPPKKPTFPPAPFLGKLALPLFWARLLKFASSVSSLDRTTHKTKKQSGQHSFFSTTPNWVFLFVFSLKCNTLFHLTQRFHKIINDFDDIRAYLNSQKTYFGTLVL